MNKKADIAMGLTWVVATIIIIFVLGVTFYISNFSGIIGFEKKFISFTGPEPFVAKSLSGYFLSNNCEDKKIFNAIIEKGDLTSCEGEKAKKFFSTLFSKEPKKVCVYIFSDTLSSPFTDYFGMCESQSNTLSLYTERFRLNDKYIIEIYGGK